REYLSRSGVVFCFLTIRNPQSAMGGVMRMNANHPIRHDAEHANAVCRSPLQPAAADLIRVGSRRWFLQTGLAGLAGLSLPALLRGRAGQAPAKGTDRKAVILLWLSGGPSHLDTWDPK